MADQNLPAGNGSKPIEIDEVQRLRVVPGDVLVLKIQERISHAVRDRLFLEMKRIFPENQVLVLDGGADLVVVEDYSINIEGA